MAELVPAPWELTGNACFLVYRFPHEFAVQHVPPDLRSRFDGSFGGVVLADYHTSDAGPYRELLFVPGRFKFGRTWRFSITRIYVSTEAGRANGRANWAIPKELAEFELYHGDDGDLVRVSRGGMPFFTLRARPYGLRIPLDSDWLPLRPSLGQVSGGRVYVTAPGGEGTAQTAEVEALAVDGRFFPDVTPFRPVLAGRVTDFRLTFPAAAVVGLEQV